MGQNNRNQQPGRMQLPEDAIAQFLKTQQQNALNEAREIALREKELELNARYAEKSLELQAKHLANKPGEARKSFTRLGYIIGAFLIIILLFIGYCLYIKQEEFVLKFFQIIGYFITTGLGYYFGKNSSKSNNDNSSESNPTSTEVVP